MQPYRALFEQSVTPLFVVDRSAWGSMNVHANEAFRRVAGLAGDNSETAVLRCLRLDASNVWAAIQTCDAKRAPYALPV
ncbi:PAS domain-containing protein [Vreelandella lionensis]|uniref:PAS domain-containing protein n=1 Tax=Vreelandella lionensis TaxID=1144478 RepID=UPI00137483E1|nr:PAS domain-containing protein [Halomonas lionensis]